MAGLDELKIKEEFSSQTFYNNLLQLTNELRDGHLYLQLPDSITQVHLKRKAFLPFTVKIIDFMCWLVIHVWPYIIYIII